MPDLTAASCLVSSQLHNTSSSRRTCTGSHLRRPSWRFVLTSGCLSGQLSPWLHYYWWYFLSYQATWLICCHHSGLQAAWHFPYRWSDAGRGQYPYEAVKNCAADPLLQWTHQHPVHFSKCFCLLHVLWLGLLLGKQGKMCVMLSILFPLLSALVPSSAVGQRKCSSISLCFFQSGCSAVAQGHNGCHVNSVQLKLNRFFSVCVVWE